MRGVLIAFPPERTNISVTAIEFEGIPGRYGRYEVDDSPRGCETIRRFEHEMSHRYKRPPQWFGFDLSYEKPNIEKVIFNDPATIVIWKDKTKTVVKCQEGDTYSPELGLAMCIAKKYLGNKGNFNEVFKKWIPEDVPVKSGLTVNFKMDGEALGKIVSNAMYNLGKSLLRDYGPAPEPDKKSTRPEPEKEEISVEKMRSDLMYHCSYVGDCDKCVLCEVNTNCDFRDKTKAGDYVISDEDIRKYYKMVFNKEV